MNPRVEVISISTPHLAGWLATTFPERVETCEECWLETELFRHKIDCTEKVKKHGKKCRCAGTGWLPCPKCGPFVDLVLLRPLGEPVRVKQLAHALYGLPDVVRMCVDMNAVWISGRRDPIPICRHENGDLNREIEVLGDTNIYDGRTVPLFSVAS